MAKINYKFCEDKVLYDSGDIEAEMLSLYKKGKRPKGGRFFYATTPTRENIINWYPFKKGSTILEVGGGLGSITGTLCQNAKKVISCEYSKRRAENIYYRHKDYDNLEVVVGNINKIKLEEKIDYVVLIGVYEYAKRFFETKNPFEDFLTLLRSFLKPGGVILIAIENRYGIKYWAGATEDHFGVKYLGLKDYKHHDIETLGKKQITDIVKKSGLFCKFYYPYPDYKMPYVVHTDQRLPLKSELSTLQIYNHGNQTYNFDYREVIGGLIDNGQYGFFANSFFVEISGKRDNLSNVVYSKSSWIRSEKYQNITRIDRDNNIIKIAKSPKGEKHLDMICKTHSDLEKLGLNVCKVRKGDEGYAVEYIEGICLAEHIYNLVMDGDVDAVIKEFNTYRSLLKTISNVAPMKKFTNKKAEKYFKKKPKEILKLGLIDLHMGNIIKKGKDFYVIDQEWVVDYDIPANYAIYFSVTMLFASVPGLNSFFDEQALLRKFGITKKEAEIYREMSIFFSQKVLMNTDRELVEHFNGVSGICLVEENPDNLKNEVLRLEKELSSVSSELSVVKSQLIGLQNRKVIKITNKIAVIKNKLLS